MKNLKNHFFLMLSAVMTMMAAMSITAFAYGWETDDTGSYYWSNKDNTEWYADGWYWVPYDNDGNAYCYYFDENGYIIKDSSPEGFIVNSDGIWEVNGVPQVIKISLPYDYFDIQPSAEGLSNSSLAGNYYDVADNGFYSETDPFIVRVVDEDTITIQWHQWKAPAEAKKESYNVYRIVEVTENPFIYGYYEFVFRDENAVEWYYKLYKRYSYDDEWKLITSFGPETLLKMY